jgi:hypothetical protein
MVKHDSTSPSHFVVIGNIASGITDEFIGLLGLGLAVAEVALAADVPASTPAGSLS